MSTSPRAQFKIFSAWLSISMMLACGQPDTAPTRSNLHGVYDEHYLIHLSPVHSEITSAEGAQAYELQSCLVDERGISLRNSCVSALKTNEHNSLLIPHAHVNFLDLASTEAEQLLNQYATFGTYTSHLFNHPKVRRGASGAAAAGGVVLGGHTTKQMLHHMAATKQSITQTYKQIDAATQIMNQRSLDIRDTTAELNKLKRIRLSLLEQLKVIEPNFLTGEFGYFSISNIDNQANHLESTFIKSSFRSDLPFDQAIRRLNSFLSDADLAQLNRLTPPHPSSPPLKIKGIFTYEFMYFIQEVLNNPPLAEQLVKWPEQVSTRSWDIIDPWVGSDPTLAHVIDEPFLTKFRQYHDLQAALSSGTRQLSISQLFDQFHEFVQSRGVPPELKGHWLWMKRYRRHIIPHRKLLTSIEQNISTSFEVSSDKSQDIASHASASSLRSKEQHLLTERVASLDDRIKQLTATKKLQLSDFTMGSKSIRDGKLNVAILNTKLKRAPKLIGLLAIGTTIFTGTTLKLMLSTFNGDKASAEAAIPTPHQQKNLQLILAHGGDLAQPQAEAHAPLTLGSAADMLKAVAHFYNSHALATHQAVRSVCLPQRTGAQTVAAQCDQLAAL